MNDQSHNPVIRDDIRQRQARIVSAINRISYEQAKSDTSNANARIVGITHAISEVSSQIPALRRELMELQQTLAELKEFS
ncbi:hypothetical protein [Methylobacterium nonmethylotrophicum]|uniref:Uncharacterized protein n=1 Tax=Methylobacterium nonmethylotrophicum TaxID=1141884 RepID=A0A4Z0NS63_9HYPH|nr:hypothetical protein [Methylobacterium nonmethylotrophicum]TGD99475.1 hypothetical protein EU555_13330 [Methylobacterium nonmethylotrophicum]